MLEDQQPAVVPVRIPAQPTTNYSVSLGSWAAAAAMTFFFPDLAPTGSSPSAAAAAPRAAARGASGSPAQAVSPVKREEDEQGASAPASAAPDVAVAAAGPAAAQEAQQEWLYRRYHAGVLELPAAEALHFQSQLKARLESGETAPPPDGMYLLPIELTEQPVGTNAAAAGAAGGDAPTPGSGLPPADSAGASRGTPRPSDVKSPAAATAAVAAGASGAASAGSRSRAAPGIGLDEVRAHTWLAAAVDLGAVHARVLLHGTGVLFVIVLCATTCATTQGVCCCAPLSKVFAWLREGLPSLYICAQQSVRMTPLHVSVTAMLCRCVVLG
jgi:hypothetical protein